MTLHECNFLKVNWGERVKATTFFKMKILYTEITVHQLAIWRLHQFHLN